jgi:hypothetical protein
MSAPDLKSNHRIPSLSPPTLDDQIQHSINEDVDLHSLDWVDSIMQYLPLIAPLALLLLTTSSANALPNIALAISDSTSQLFDPTKFQPVCPASDGFYQLMKSIANTMIGQENVIEYGPLVASVLLRVRLELCVFESFVYEAVVPFIKQKGLSWVLPLHETLETFVAGTIFAVASNFILLGSTKIITVILIYFDALFGFPARFLGNLFMKWTTQKSVPNKIASFVKFLGEIFGAFRRSIEAIDTFVGRYLVFGTTAYIIFKFLHYKFFNNIIPF